VFKKKIERIKDILIDHVYDFCYNEIVQRIEGGGDSFTYDDPAHLKELKIKEIVDSISKSRNRKAYYTTRNTESCQIIFGTDSLHSSLIDKFQKAGFSKGKKL